MIDELPPSIQLKLADPIWRLTHLYYIRDDTGQTVQFEPNPEQLEIIHALYTHGKKKIVILKARQLGMSTVIDIILTDSIVFSRGVQAAIVDLTQTDATKKLENKVKFAFNNLPRALRESYQIGKDSDKRFQVRPSQTSQLNHGWSEIQAGMNARGDTFQILHISEWGAIQHEDEQRSIEIATGALPAAKSGTIIVETTWKGPKSGPLWDIVDNAMKTQPEDMTDEDFHLFFFPWFTDQRYKLEGNYDQIPTELTEYFDEIEQQQQVTISPEQRLWYFKRAYSLGIYRFREYPSTLEECFRGFIEGAIYQEEVLKARTDKRITRIPNDQSNFVHTVWDLGSPLNTVTWYFQIQGYEFHFIDVDVDKDLTLTERVAKMLSKPYLYGSHLLPHDAMAKERSGLNFYEQLSRLGLQNLRVLPRPDDIWPGINHALSMFSRFWFDSQACEPGLIGLENYRTKKDKQNDFQTDVPVHDRNSHIADPIRVLAEADQLGMLTSRDQNVKVAARQSRRRRHQRALSNYRTRN